MQYFYRAVKARFVMHLFSTFTAVWYHITAQTLFVLFVQVLRWLQNRDTPRRKPNRVQPSCFQRITVNKQRRKTKRKINCFTGKLFLKEQNKERSGSGYEASLQCAQSSLTFPHLQQHWASFSQLTQENMTEFLKASFKECIPFLSMASNNNTQNEGALACPCWAVAQLFQDSSGRGESAGFGHSRFAGGGQTWAVKMQF